MKRKNPGIKSLELRITKAMTKLTGNGRQKVLNLI